MKTNYTTYGILFLFFILVRHGYSQVVTPTAIDDPDPGENTTWFRDSDQDGLGDPFYGKISETKPSGYVANKDDCDDSDPTIRYAQNWFEDADGDGYGSTLTRKKACFPPMGYVGNADDCNDSNASINPATVWYSDVDGDGYGNASVTKKGCSRPSGYVLNGDDYDDSTSKITNIAPRYFYRDADGDGFGDPNNKVYYSKAPEGYVEDNTDECPGEYGTDNGCKPTTPVPNDENYIHTRIYQRGMSVPDSALYSGDVIETKVYYDGLGRPMQRVAIRASPDKKDIITHIGYDAYGRQAKEWLSYKSGGDDGSYRDTDQEIATKNYYMDHYPEDFPGLENVDVNAYSQKQFEPSPLNRVQKQAAPGKAWKLGSGHEIEFSYDTNSSQEVRLYKATTTATETAGDVYTYEPSLSLSTANGGYYKAGELYKTITYDENHNGTGKDHSTEEFKDKQGRVVLKRTYNNEQPHDTYYVYDNYGNLTYVLPPKAEAHSAKPNATKLKELCYQYVYDGRNRLVEKKIPGKAWDYIVYNKLDQPVLTQDSLLRADGQWLFTKYDAFGRVAYTGIKKYSNGRKALQYAANNSIFTQYEAQESTAVAYAGVPVFYSSKAIPKAMDEIHTINYYDTYVGTAGLSVPARVYDRPKATNTKGLPTVSKVRVLGTAHWITTITGYDNKGRVIYTASKNPYLNTTDILEYKLDFVGKILETKTTHTKGSNAPIVTTDQFEYDHAGRLIRQLQCINGDCGGSTSGEDLVLNSAVTGTTDKVAGKSIRLTPGFHIKATSSVSFSASISPAGELIAENGYDDLGQLKEKKVGNTPDKPLQTLNYAYNVRGWLKEINDVTNLSNKLFAFKINYNTKEMGASNTPLYNGNISETIWKTANDLVGGERTRGYAYTYDALNRITYADYGIKTTGGFNLSTGYDLRVDNYDKNGNITSLYRNSQAPGEAMDDIRYVYNAGNIGNKLLKVTETATSIYKDDGFKDGANTNNEYTYDPNGNLKTDANKGITGITYNYLNLPTKVTVNNPEHTGNIQYIYGADGSKLKKVAVANGQTTTTEYAGNYIYENSQLKQVSHPEGYFEPKAGGGYQYVYYLKDHLNNVRITFADDNGDGTVGTSEIRREQNYYPFGLEHKGYNNILNGPENNYQTYQSKEHEKELGLDWHDFGARHYMADIVRTTTQDPLAEEFYSVSPYSFLNNSPPNFIDPDGRAAFNPIYGEDGSFLGTDEYGLKGEAIIYGGEFTQGMNQLDILEEGGQFLSDYASNLPGDQFAKFDDPTWNKVFSHSYDLKDRPDYDGVLTLSEANAWARNGNGEPLFVDAGKIDLSTIDMGDFRNKNGFYRTSGYFNFINPLQPDYFNKSVGEVYGSIKISVLNNSGEVQLGGANGLIDVYNFEQHRGGGAKIWTRNQLTKYGKYKATVNGRYNITDFSIYGYGKAYLTNLGGY
ncbi:DUF6443 domain-containing protein [Sinomicrobium weinanense]|uniref:DUF6443 domain-containing protein n=1 Tax=Sinomicrobium weinanense TaxID=2842200 RepID=A0A926JR57_9FLAO|nr:DUF6443 domain-containing protein [Sinomicrobium weinanense]MBC9795856.1 hypothetical protein [Sinomicrobium weinanense]MBU3125376.1 hypothetical protein [Sinomicrobium weinanense]